MKSSLRAKRLGVNMISDFQTKDDQQASLMVTKSSEDVLNRLRVQLKII